MEIKLLKQILLGDEGKKLKVYPDSLGVLTIGVGRNLQTKGISSEEANYLLENDIQEALADIEAIFHADTLTHLNDARQLALVDMAFQLGRDRLRKFTKFIAAIEDSEWEKAAIEGLNSLWARQCPERAHRITWMIQYGKIHDFYSSYSPDPSLT